MKKSYVKESASSYCSFSFDYYISYNINVFTVFEAFSQAHQSERDNKTKLSVFTRCRIALAPVRKPYRIRLTVDDDFGAISVREQSSTALISGKWSVTYRIGFVLNFGAERVGVGTVAEVKK